MAKFLGIHLSQIKRFNDVFTQFERKVDVQNNPFGWLHFENRCVFKSLNNDDEKCMKNSTVNYIVKLKCTKTLAKLFCKNCTICFFLFKALKLLCMHFLYPMKSDQLNVD